MIQITTAEVNKRLKDLQGSTGENNTDAVVMLCRPPIFKLEKKSRKTGQRTTKPQEIGFFEITKNDVPLITFQSEATETEVRAVLAALQFAHIKTSRENLLGLLKEATEDVTEYLEADLLTLQNEDDDPNDEQSRSIVGEWHGEAKKIFAQSAIA